MAVRLQALALWVMTSCCIEGACYSYEAISCNPVRSRSNFGPGNDVYVQSSMS